MNSPKNIGIIGSGPAGTVLAMMLNKRGHQVTLFEKHGNPLTSQPKNGRSINLTLTQRGLLPLAMLGVSEAVMQASVPAQHRIVHHVGGNLSYQPYDDGGNALHSISRKQLNCILHERAREQFQLKYIFNSRLTNIDLNTSLVTINTPEGMQSHQFDVVIGADGAFSAVRAAMQHQRRFNFMQEYSDHVNIELTLPPGHGWSGERNGLHVWPRKDILLIAFPNCDGSFTLTLQLPAEGPNSPEWLLKSGQANSFFTRHFPDMARYISDFPAALVRSQPVYMVSIKCGKWFVGGNICLIGDAAHAVFPSYGQGTNAALEDCMILDSLLEETSGDFKRAFELFYECRKPATDALCDLSREHYHNLRLSIGEMDAKRTKVRELLRSTYPEIGHSLYSNIAFTHRPYNKILEMEKFLNEIIDNQNAPSRSASVFSIKANTIKRR